MKKNKEYYMKLAIKEAIKAKEKDEVPIGAVIVLNNKVIARGYNIKESSNCAINHAEIVAIKKASKKLNSWYLNDCEIYVTVQPCEMCQGAIISSRIKAVYYGAQSLKNELTDDIYSNNSLNHKILTVESGILKDDCSRIVTDYFKEKRG